jgi:hypothetical protein
MLAAPRRAFVALVLVVLTLVSGGCGGKAGPGASATSPNNLSATAPSGALQEVAPPGAVQQLNERLNDRAPQVRVLAPQDNALLPAGPWTLKLQVSDWPLSDASPLGLGPHLVVQLDDQIPIRITSSDAAAAVEMPDLRPGSHRVTVYAARPWGEAVKAPGANAQIRVHRVARNAAELPASGSAQLIATSPEAPQATEPVLIDWLLLDAPLQNLRGDDARWRLRVSVNGDSFLVDRQTPLWLKGFKRGSNAVQLELLDGRGDPLNPPFNSVVREVVIGSGSQPAWLRPNLSPNDLALLAGETLPPELPEAAPVEPAPQPVPEPQPEPEPEPSPPPSAEAKLPAAEQTEAPPAEPAEAPAAVEAAPAPTETDAESADAPSPEPEPEPEPEEVSATPATPEPLQQPSAAPPTTPAPERIAPQTSLSGSARDQVNADGSLQQPTPRGPLAGLREKLGG